VDIQSAEKSSHVHAEYTSLPQFDVFARITDVG
jgi:hypothetical protein